MHYADYKTILSPQNGINVYRGCTHGCIYCDSRSKCYRILHEFTDIEVKRDAAEILDGQLKRKKHRCMISTGAMSDPYIHLEEKLGITRQCLEVIYKHGFGVAIQTKSVRILRDLALLKAINEQAKCVIEVTLTTFDEGLCKKIEPDVSSTAERVEILKAAQSAGIPTVVWLGPVLPFINDTEQNLRGILDYCFETNVRGIINFGFGLTLREGNREYFYQCLDKTFPNIKQKYINRFGSAYVCNSPDNSRLTALFQEFCRRRGVMYEPYRVFGYIREFEPKARQISIFD